MAHARSFTWKRPAWAMLAVAIGLGLSAREADAQVVAGSPYMSSYRVSDYFVAPGWYGTSYGFASYGFPQTYSVFSAYPGPVLRDELPALRPHAGSISASASGGPATSRRDMSTGLRIIPRPAFSYRTFPVMYGTAGPVDGPAPPFGYYAPALGPGPT